MMDLNKELRKFLDVFSSPVYLGIVVVLSALSFAVYGLLLNYSFLYTLYLERSYMLLLQMIPRLITGFVRTTTTLSIVLTGLVSIAVGVNFALVAFRLVEMSSFGTESAGSVGGMFLAVLAPACPACATTIFAFAGMSSLFAVLPFKGTEIKVLALLLLIGSAGYIVGQIDDEVCELCQV